MDVGCLVAQGNREQPVQQFFHSFSFHCFLVSKGKGSRNFFERSDDRIETVVQEK